MNGRLVTLARAGAAEAVDLAAEAPAEEKIEGTALTSEVMRSTGNYG